MTPPRTSIHARKSARLLRKEQTEAERVLWEKLRNHQLNGIHFRRQHPIGNYVVDFCAPRMKLVIELDGNPHKNQVEYDQERAAFLVSRGYRILRFWNSEITDHIDETLERIKREV